MAEDLDKKERKAQVERSQEQAAQSKVDVRPLSHCYS